MFLFIEGFCRGFPRSGFLVLKSFQNAHPGGLGVMGGDIGFS